MSRWGVKPESQTRLKVMVLAGGPDRERSVSLKSGAAVAIGLREAGHEVIECDIHPHDLSALDEWDRWGGDVVFPVVHGSWGEGGPLQRLLDQRHVPYVGCRAPAADLCMDKHQTKLVLARNGLATPRFELIGPIQEQDTTLEPPVVIKPPREGSSIDLMICRDAEQLSQARHQLSHHERLLVEQYIAGKELTVGVLEGLTGDQALAPLWIAPQAEFYSYEAKYERDDTRYVLDPHQIDLPAPVMDQVRRMALEAHRVLGCRHMSRVDFMVDGRHRPWILEVNTVPGFTNHSLLPKAAAYAGLPLADLVDRLVRLALRPA